MRNRHPGPCFRCGEIVERGKGHFQMTREHGSRRWLLQHAECAIAYRWTGIGYDGKRGPRPTAKAQP